MDEISQISAAAMDFHNKRLEAALNNLARDGMVVSGKATKDVVAMKSGFSDLIGQVSIDKAQADTRRVQRPDSPYADAEGFVTVYDMDQTELVSEALEAYRMYESNVRAMGLYSKMISKSYEIGK